jgi:hypothetical protein
MRYLVIPILILSACESPSRCGGGGGGGGGLSYDNVGACNRFIQKVKCGTVDISAQVNCQLYASTACDISSYFDCLSSKYVCKNGMYDPLKLSTASECANKATCTGVKPAGGATTSSAGNCVGAPADMGSGGGGQADLSTRRDLAGPPSPDFASSKLTCYGIVESLVDGTCADLTSCLSMAQTASRDRFINALSCGQEWCMGTNGVGPADCVVNQSTQRLEDAPGHTGKCTPCLNNALAKLFLDVCSPANDPNCNPSVCVSLYDQCLNDN